MVVKVEKRDILIDSIFVRDCFGFKTFPALVGAVNRGAFPQPDFIVPQRKDHRSGDPDFKPRPLVRWRWLQGTLLDWIRDNHGSDAMIKVILGLKEKKEE